MPNFLDDQLAGKLALAIAQSPRANLQQIAARAGISKATLYRIAPTREAVIELLMQRSTAHLENALEKADLARPPFLEGLNRLTTNVLQGSAFYMFWNVAQWIQNVDEKPAPDKQHSLPSFYGDALEEFFLRGQKAGVFKIDMPVKWLVKAYDFLLYAAVDSAQRGEIATVGMACLVDKLFLYGSTEMPITDINNVPAS